jgi:tripartite-type tricarboxylate transporter receptor subunit TctC
MIDRRRALGVVGGVAGLLGGLWSIPEVAAFPDKPVTMVVGFGAGGMTDVSSRLLAQKLEKTLGVNVVVENKPGAGGVLAINSVGQMPADGYTIVSMLTDGPFTSTYQGKPIDFSKWAVVGGYMPQERVVFAHKSAPFNTFEEMVAFAKSNPVTFADGGAFWSSRVVEAFGKKHGLQLRLVPFRSGAEGSAAILGGHVMIAETGVGTSAWKAAKKGDLKILATLSPGGLKPFGMADVPTLDKLGADYVVRIFYGYAVSAATPPDRIEKLRASFKAAVEDPEMQEKLKALDLTPMWIEPKEYEATLRSVTDDANKLRAYLAK